MVILHTRFDRSALRRMHRFRIAMKVSVQSRTDNLHGASINATSRTGLIAFHLRMTIPNMIESISKLDASCGNSGYGDTTQIGAAESNIRTAIALSAVSHERRERENARAK
jgi:hypothetical protein